MGYYANCRNCNAMLHSKTRTDLGKQAHAHAKEAHPVEYGMAKVVAGKEGLADNNPWRLYDFYP